MIKNILNLEGAIILRREAQKSIHGDHMTVMWHINVLAIVNAVQEYVE